MTDKVEAPEAEEAVQNPLAKSVTFTVSAAELNAGITAELKRYAKKAKIPGFRPGHVPFATVQAMYGQQAYMDTMNRLIAEAYEKAAIEAQLRVAGTPEIKAEETQEGEDPKFTATVECYPEFQTPDFSALTLKKYTCTVGDAEVQKTLDIMLKQRVSYEEEAGRQAGAEDRVTLNFKGTKDGVAFPGGSAEGFQFVLAQGRMLPEFEAAVTGMAAGEKKSFNLTFPADYGSKDLAGQEVVFEVEVTKVEKGVLPEVNDEFAKSLGTESAEEMLKEIRINLNREVNSRIETRVKKEVLDAVAAVCTFALPKALVAEEEARLADQATKAYEQYTGKKPSAKLDPVMFEQEATRRVRLGLLMAQLIDEEKLTATEEEVNALIADMAAAYDNPEEMIEWTKKNPEQVFNFQNVATENKAVNFILSEAQTSEEAVEFDKLMAGE